jgi:hypothetical protein
MLSIILKCLLIYFLNSKVDRPSMHSLLTKVVLQWWGVRKSGTLVNYISITQRVPSDAFILGISVRTGIIEAEDVSEPDLLCRGCGMK